MMGGSGGFFDGTVNFHELYDKLREAQGNTDRQAFFIYSVIRHFYWKPFPMF